MYVCVLVCVHKYTYLVCVCACITHEKKRKHVYGSTPNTPKWTKLGRSVNVSNIWLYSELICSPHLPLWSRFTATFRSVPAPTPLLVWLKTCSFHVISSFRNIPDPFNKLPPFRHHPGWSWRSSTSFPGAWAHCRTALLSTAPSTCPPVASRPPETSGACQWPQRMIGWLYDALYTHTNVNMYV